jgi:hypothetical protein
MTGAVTIASVRAHGVRQLLSIASASAKAIGLATIKARCRLTISKPKKF